MKLRVIDYLKRKPSSFKLKRPRALENIAVKSLKQSLRLPFQDFIGYNEIKVPKIINPLSPDSWAI